MARTYRTEVREEKAVRFRLTVSNLTDYMNAFLIIYNNAKGNKDVFYKVYNDYSDNIYVVAAVDEREQVKRYLSKFAEITREEETVAIIVDVSTDYTNFDKDYVDADICLGEED